MSKRSDVLNSKRNIMKTTWEGSENAKSFVVLAEQEDLEIIARHSRDNFLTLFPVLRISLMMQAK